MLKKIYVVALLAGILITFWFTYYAWSWLQSIGNPANALAGFEYNAAIAWGAAWLFALLLLLLGNAVFWQTDRSWPIWLSLVFFAVCVLTRTLILDPGVAGLTATPGSAAQGSHGISLGSVVLDIGMIVAAAAVVFFDHFLLVRLRSKTYPVTSPSDLEVPYKEKSSSSDDEELLG